MLTPVQLKVFEWMTIVEEGKLSFNLEEQSIFTKLHDLVYPFLDITNMPHIVVNTIERERLWVDNAIQQFTKNPRLSKKRNGRINFAATLLYFAFLDGMMFAMAYEERINNERFWQKGQLND